MTGADTAALSAAAAVLAGQEPEPFQPLVRIPLTVAVLGTAALLCWLMWRSWQRRIAAQDRTLAVLPAAPALSEPLVEPADAAFIGTTAAGAWLERVAGQGLTERGDVRLHLHPEGLRAERLDDATPLFVPAEALRGARADRALSGRVVGPDQMLVVTWVHSGQELDSGFVLRDRAAQPAYVRTLNRLAGAAAAEAPGRPQEDS